jgi:transcriptional antiterminator RfaH
MLQFGVRFPWIADESINAMRTLASAVPQRPLFEPGQRLVVSEGPFRGLDAIFLEPDGDARVIALMSLLGQEQRLSFAVSELQRAPA